MKQNYKRLLLKLTIIIAICIFMTILFKEDGTKIYEVNSVNDIKDWIQKASAENKKILVVTQSNKSTSHNKTYEYCNKGYFNLCLSNFNKVLELDSTKKVIRVQSHCTWFQLVKILDPLNLTPKTTQAGLHFTIGGSICSNIHSKKIRSSLLIDSIKQIKFIDGTGTEHIVNEGEELFKALFGSMGLLGIITEVTLYLEDNFQLEYSTVLCKRNEFYSELMNLYNHKNFYTCNFSINLNDSNDKAVFYSSFDTGKCHGEQFIEKNYNNTQSTKIMYSLKIFICQIIIQFFNKEWGQNLIFDVSNNDSNSNAKYQCYNNFYANWIMPLQKVEILEIFFPLTPDVHKTLIELYNICSKYNKYLVSSGRMVKRNKQYPKEQSFLSFINDERTYVGTVLNYIEVAKNKPKFMKELEEFIIRNEGTYHICYDNKFSKRTFRKLFPGWERFIEVKQRVDPNCVFSNSFYNDYLIN